MKAKFLIAAALALVAAPAFATALSNPDIGTPSGDQIAKPAGSDINSDTLTSPFGRTRQDKTDMRPMDRNRNSVPPRMDASGVPDPRT